MVPGCATEEELAASHSQRISSLRPVASDLSWLSLLPLLVEGWMKNKAKKLDALYTTRSKTVLPCCCDEVSPLLYGCAKHILEIRCGHSGIAAASQPLFCHS